VGALPEKLPSILVLAVLVGIFISIRRHSASPRMRLWVFAWALIFLHFVMQACEGRAGVLEQIIETMDLAALELGGIVFAVSMSEAVKDIFWRRVLLWSLGVPAVLCTAGATFDWPAHWALGSLIILLAVIAAVLPLIAYRGISLFYVSLALLILLTGSWAASAQFRGHSDPALNGILALAYGITGVLYWKRVQRMTLGAVTVIGGFITWGAVFPIGMAMDRFAPNFQVNSELWNVPKFFVAFGMILSLLEDQTRLLEETTAREHAENSMMERFARVTSALLTSRDPAMLCGEIASSVTSTSGFHFAAVLLAGADGGLSLAGWSGITPAESVGVSEQVAKWTAAKIDELCAGHERLGAHSFRVGQTGLLPLRATFFLTDPAATGTMPMVEVIVPAVPARGRAVGWMWLCAPEEVFAASPAEIVKIELLAADLAVTLENKRLHHQLVRSEKLAALGQLVAGVAHELNNPLAAVIGYSDLLADEVRVESTQARIAKLGHEARRMKRIVEGLLRFARQKNPEEPVTNFEAALRDAVLLREYHLRTRGVQIFTEIAPDFPGLAIGEDELKQVLLNLINNSVDAIEDSKEKVIRIHASCHGDHAEIRVEDSGPGFSDLNRAMDPFYTTKPIGKGTGLGLSICFGIVQECHGEIHLANKQPYGAIVTIELLVAEPIASHA